MAEADYTEVAEKIAAAIERMAYSFEALATELRETRFAHGKLAESVDRVADGLRGTAESSGSD